MGCSSSMSGPLLEKKPLGYPDVSRERSPLTRDGSCTETNTHQYNCNSSSNKTETNTGENIQINSTRIVIIARETRETDSTDSSSIVPIFKSNEQDGTMSTCSPHLSACTQQCDASAFSRSRSMSLPGGIKSVLKTGRSDPRSHMLANRPIKTVTFVDSVRVLAIY